MLIAGGLALGLVAAAGRRGGVASGAATPAPSSPSPSSPSPSSSSPARNPVGAAAGKGDAGEFEATTAPALLTERSREPRRGRRARSPAAIPPAGWWDILWRTVEEAGRDRLMAVAAGVAFYALLSVFPAITALVSLYGLVFDPAGVLGHLAALSSMLPPGAFGIVEDQVSRVVASGRGGLTLSFLAGLGIALWSATAGVKAIFDALNVVYGEEEKRSFLWLNLVALSFTLGAIALFLVFVVSVVVVPLVLAAAGVTGLADSALPMLRWPFLFLVLLGALSILYRFGPSRRSANWRWVSPGGLVASFTWIAVSLIFAWYLQNFGNYNAIYGSLGAVIGLMMWMWLSAVVVLFGAELNAEIEHQTAADTTGQGLPLGARGAAMADSVGASPSRR